MNNRILSAHLLAVAALSLAGAPARGAADKPVEAVLASAPQVPPPVSRAAPALVVVRLEAIEKVGELMDGVQYEFWTFNGTVPGPFIPVRVGDTVEVRFKNNEKNRNTHTIDFHAATGTGGGAAALTTEPGKESVLRFKTLNPGFYVYHCAANPVPVHIANGLYGAILVEPEGGLRKADREYYVMQSEFYTEGDLGAKGLQGQSSTKAMREHPEYVVFNGKFGSLTGDGALKAKVGEQVRIYFANIGPNLSSSFHVIGEIFDRVYREGSLADPTPNVQTTMVPSGSASVVEFKVDVPGDYTLVDHAIFRIIRGAAGVLHVDGAEVPSIFQPMVAGSDAPMKH
ncbi:MAG: copper-containing nitrite reductase [Thermoanaerobaculia bacterium]